MNPKLDELLETLEEAERQIADVKRNNLGSPDVVDFLSAVEAELNHIKQKLDKLTNHRPDESE